jgi:hypothetical protein
LRVSIEEEAWVCSEANLLPRKTSGREGLVGSIVAMTRRREKSKKKGDLNLESKWDFGRSMIRMATKFTFSIAKHDLEQFVRMDLEQRQLAEELDLIMEESHSVLRKHHEQNRRNRQVHER